MNENSETIITRITRKFPIDERLTRLIVEAAIEEIHRLGWIEESNVDVARHLFRHVSPECCAHYLQILQGAVQEQFVDDQYYDEVSQRLSQGREIALAKGKEFAEEQTSEQAQRRRMLIRARIKKLKDSD